MLVGCLSATGSFDLADVCARAKNFIATGHDDRTYPSLARELMKQSLHLRSHLSIERILLLRPVELDRGDRARFSILQGLIHIRLRSCCRGCSHFPSLAMGVSR